MVSEFFAETLLPNGVRIITERMPHSHSAAIGVWVRSGPRYEQPSQSGISHFVEHMLFKGTRTRTARQINESLYPIGGQLNAFTDREFTCYTAVVLGENVPLALEVISDMLTNSVFAPEELAKEKKVILEEIRAIEDTPEDLVNDVFVSTIWPDHPLGRPVIGGWETVEALTREGVTSYVSERYTPDSILVAAAGQLEHAQMVAEVERWLGRMSGALAPAPAPESPQAAAQSALIYRKTEQAHLCLGMPAFAQQDDRNYPLIILDTVFGAGPHSWLFDEIRENLGLAYSVGSAVTAYSEAGLFTVYASTSPGNLKKVIGVMRNQMDRILQDGLSEEEIDRARQHLRASLLLSHESTGSRMGRIANSYLYFGRVLPFQEVIDKLYAVTPEAVTSAAREVFRWEASAMAVIGPIRPGSKQAEALRAA